ncbi:MAG: hypothetical protein V4543_17025 [Bacteroidota bacterium]
MRTLAILIAIFLASPICLLAQSRLRGKYANAAIEVPATQTQGEIPELKPEAPRGRNTVIKFAPIALFFGKASMVVQHSLSPKIAIGADLDYVFKDFANLSGGNLLSQKIAPYLRYSPETDGLFFPDGSYFQASVAVGHHAGVLQYYEYNYVSDNRIYRDVDFYAVGISGWAGRQIVTKYGLTIDIGYGLQYYPLPDNLLHTTHSGELRDLASFSTFTTGPGCPFIFRFDIGYAF